MPPKKKQEKMSLGNFLSDQSLGSWADEMEDMPMPSGDSRGYNRDGPRREYNVPDFGAARDRDMGGGDRPGYSIREPLPLPTRPPYTAHLGNLSFDVTSADVEGLFAECQVTNVRLVEDRIERKPKGFGYVEFATLDGLKQALTFSGSQFQGRNIRVSVADPPKDRPEARELNDWTRKGPLPDLPNRRPSDRGFRSFDASSDAGSERSMSRKGFAPEGDGKVRDFGNWERKGPLSPVPGAAVPAGREGGRPARDPSKSFERRDSPSWGEGRPATDPAKAPRPAPERQPTAAEMDNQWRARMKPDAPASPSTPTPDPSTPTSPVAAAPATRPKLNLQKRTVSEAPQDAAAASGASDAKASPFGAARPINSAQREREIEEKRLALRQKKDEEDKVAEAKKQADKASKAEAKADRAAAKTSQENGKSAPKEKENGAAPQTQAGRQYEILRRMNEGEEESEDTVDANGTIAEDNAVKPKEVVRDRTTGEKTQSTTEGLEEEGWSTVPAAKGRGKRAGGTTGRALAS